MMRALATPFLFIVSFSLILVSCGFHPRGSVSQLTEPGSVYIDVGRGVTIRTEIEEALQDQAFTIARNRDDADILLRLADEEESERIVSVQRNGRVSELELNHSINMQIAQSIDENAPRYDTTRPPNRVEVRREYTYNERGVLGKEAEARILRDEMREELVRQIVLRAVARLAPTSVSQHSVNQPRGRLATLYGFYAGTDLFG